LGGEGRGKKSSSCPFGKDLVLRPFSWIERYEKSQESRTGEFTMAISATIILRKRRNGWSCLRQTGERQTCKQAGDRRGLLTRAPGWALERFTSQTTEAGTPIKAGERAREKNLSDGGGRYHVLKSSKIEGERYQRKRARKERGHFLKQISTEEKAT